MLSDSSESWDKWAQSFHWMGEIQAHILHVNNPLFSWFLEGVQQCIPPEAGNSRFCNQTVKVQLWVQLRWNIALLKFVGVLLLAKVSLLFRMDSYPVQAKKPLFNQNDIYNAVLLSYSNIQGMFTLISSN